MAAYRYYLSTGPAMRPTDLEPDSIQERDFVGADSVVYIQNEYGMWVGKLHEWSTFINFLMDKDINQLLPIDPPELSNLPQPVTAAPAEPPKKDHINPSHYKQLLVITDSNGTVTDTIQWLEHLQYKPFWRNNMRAFVQAVLDLCADKYLSRMGMKDDETQEMQKVLWYTKFATAIMLNNFQPIRVNDIETILDKKNAVLLKFARVVSINGLEEQLLQNGFTEEELNVLREKNNG